MVSFLPLRTVGIWQRQGVQKERAPVVARSGTGVCIIAKGGAFCQSVSAKIIFAAFFRAGMRKVALESPYSMTIAYRGAVPTVNIRKAHPLRAVFSP